MLLAEIEINASHMWYALMAIVFLVASLTIHLPDNKQRWVRIIGLLLAVLFGALLVATFDSNHAFENYVRTKWFDSSEEPGEEKDVLVTVNEENPEVLVTVNEENEATPRKKGLADVSDVVWQEDAKETVRFPSLPNQQWWVIMYEGGPEKGKVVVGETYEHDGPLENVRVYIQEDEEAKTYITPVKLRSSETTEDASK